MHIDNPILFAIAYLPSLDYPVHRATLHVRRVSLAPDSELKEEEYPRTTPSYKPQGNDHHGRHSPDLRPLEQLEHPPGELNPSSTHIFHEILQTFHHFSSSSRSVRSQHRPYRKPSSTRDMDHVLSLSQHTRQGNLTCSRIVLLANLLQTAREFEEVWEVLLRVPRNVFTEVIVLKVVRRFLPKIKRVILPSTRDNRLT